MSETYYLPVRDQEVLASATREASVLANCIGYMLVKRGASVYADDLVIAAQHAIDQGWKIDPDLIS